MDRLPHPFSRARTSTHRTSLLHRRSRPRTLRRPRRLPRRVFSGVSPHHSACHFRRRLRPSRAGATATRSRSSRCHRACAPRFRPMHGPLPTGGQPRIPAPSRPLLRLLSRSPSPNLERIVPYRENKDVGKFAKSVSGQRLARCHKSCSFNPLFQGLQLPVRGRDGPSPFTARFALPLSGYNILCFSLDRHNRREYFKHPRGHFSDLP